MTDRIAASYRSIVAPSKRPGPLNASPARGSRHPVTLQDFDHPFHTPRRARAAARLCYRNGDRGLQNAK